MDRKYSTSTISTTNSLSCSISSKNMLRNLGHCKGFKANRNAKYRAKGVVSSSRWRSEARRNSSLTTLMKATRKNLRSNTSLASNLGRGFEGMRLGNMNSNSGNADFKDNAPCEEIYFKNSIDQPNTISIKSAALNRALHRDIDSKIVNNNDSNNSIIVKPAVSYSQKGEERWSAKSSGKTETALFKPTRRGSDGHLNQL